MRTTIVKSVFAGLFLFFSLPLKAQTQLPADKTINDSSVVYSVSDGQLSLVNNAGDLYLYEEASKGYKATYCLFTSCPLVHLGSAADAKTDEYIMIQNGQGNWVNVSTGDGASSDSKFLMSEKAPYRCVRSIDGRAQILLSVNASKQSTDRTVRLIVLPNREEPSLTCYIEHNDSVLMFDEFKKIKFNSKNSNPLHGYALVIDRSNSVVVDSIRCTDSLLMVCSDSPELDGQLVFPLDSIVTGALKEIDFTVYYRTFKADGSIASTSQKAKIHISWAGGVHNGLKVFMIIIILLFAIILALATASHLAGRRLPWLKSVKAGEKSPKEQDDHSTVVSELKQQIKSLTSERDAAQRQLSTVSELKRQINSLTSERDAAQRQLSTVKQKADADVESAKSQALQYIANEKEKLSLERNAQMDSILSLAQKLKELVSGIPNGAFGGTGEMLKLGADSYYKSLDSIALSDRSLKESLDAMQEHSIELLNIGSSSWMNRLGRVYSYMSVDALRDRLESEGMRLDTVATAFHTFTALLAAQDIVIANCSPGYDSDRDPMTHLLFRLDTQVDHITNWLGGGDIVRQAIPNHGSTIYDFGTLAWFTTTDTTIRQGRVIYYSE